MELNFWIALIAGLISFLSPCVLPLVPAYVGYMGGRVTNTVAAQTAGSAQVSFAPTLASRLSTFLHGVFFVGGFTFVFVAVGLLLTAFLRQVGGQNVNLVMNIIGRAGGVLIILFGLHFTGLLSSVFNRVLSRPALIGSPLITLAVGLAASALILWALVEPLLALPVLALFWLWLILGGAFGSPAAFWTNAINRLQNILYADTRRQMVASGQQSYSSSAIMGVIFAAGWTPCIGPIYGGILTMAATGADIGGSAVLLMAYSLGLGIPFLLTALLMDSAQPALRKLQRHLHKIELVSGVFLIIIGILVATGSLQQLSQNFATEFADFTYQLEECVISVTQGELPFGDIINCVRGVEPAATSLSPAPPTTAAAANPLLWIGHA